MTPDRLENLFAFAYYAWCQDTVPDSPVNDDHALNCLQLRGKKRAKKILNDTWVCLTAKLSSICFNVLLDTLNSDFLNEYKRMGFNNDPAWKITDINSKFQ